MLKDFPMLRNFVLILATTALLAAADISGKWSATVETDAGSGTPSFTFKQAGETSTGTYSGQLGEAPLTGSIKGDDIEFSFKAAPQGDTVTIKYKGKLSGGNQMKGTVDLGGMATGTFTATKP